MSRVKNFYRVLIAILTLVIFSGCASLPKSTQKINVQAAISLKKALEIIQKQYQKSHPEVAVSFNFVASGTLQKQIEEGVPADLFISAGKSQMDQLVTKGLVQKDTLAPLVGNKLVLVTNRVKSTPVSNLSGLISVSGTIALGIPETVPAGIYAKDSLQYLKIWDALQSRIIYGNDVQQVLTYVASGNADYGLVYQTDALNSDKVKVIASAPANSHKPITYPAALLKNASNSKAAKEFLQYLQSKEAQKVFRECGFTTTK